MALESEYFPQQTSGGSPLSPEDRGVYKKILFGFFGVYAAAVVVMGFVLVGNAHVQKQADIAMMGTWPLQQESVTNRN